MRGMLPSLATALLVTAPRTERHRLDGHGASP